MIGPSSGRGRQQARRSLTRLRIRLAVVVATAAIVGLIVLAAVTVVVDDRLRSDRFFVDLQGRANRAAALVFLDTNERWDAGGVADDAVASSSDAVVVAMAPQHDLLLALGSARGVEPLLSAGYADGAEAGVRGLVTIDGESVPAAAAPFFIGDQPVGAVVVADRPEPDPDHARFQLLVLVATAGLSAASAGVAWVLAGRSVHPLTQSLDREDAFLAMAAHDLRSPLGRIQAVIDSAMLTVEDLEPGETTERLGLELQRLSTVTLDAARSVNNLLLMGQADRSPEGVGAELEREIVDLGLLVSDRVRSQPQLVLEVIDPVAVRGDHLLLKHAVDNLITNARRHGRPRSGPAFIEVFVYLEDDGAMVDAVVEVIDNGPGFGLADGHEVVERLFDRYRTGHGPSGSGRGTGLGLWIVKSIVEGHGGWVEAGDRTDGITGAWIRFGVPAVP